MKTIVDWGGQSASSQWSMGALGLALVFVLGVAGLSREALGGTFGDGFIPLPPIDGAGQGGGSEPPPKPPMTQQECFDQHLRNQARCKDIWCKPASFIWITWTNCQNHFLDKCIDAAQLVYQCCLTGGTPCGGNGR
jgi:hypothetical protein